MELTAGYPYWLINAGLLHHYPKLVSDSKAEVIIIGGGITGALAAYQFTEAKIDCILVDGRSIGLGSSCASTSLLQYELDIPLHELINICGKSAANRAYILCAEAIEKLVALMEKTGYQDFARSKSLYFSTKPDQRSFMDEEFKARRNAGLSVSMMTGDEMKNEYGIKALYGILSETGATIDTYTLTHHLLQYCIHKGVRVYDRSKISSIQEQPDQIILKTEDGNTLHCKYVVNATGYEVINFIDKDIVNFDCTYAIASERQDSDAPLWKDAAMFWNTDDPYLYMRLTPDNRLLAGGRDEPYDNKATRHLLLEKKAKQLENDVKAVLPGINVKTEFCWSGTFGKTADSLPYIGALDNNSHCYYALGFGGNGITFAQVAAEIICDFIRGKKNDDASLFAFSRRSVKG